MRIALLMVLMPVLAAHAATLDLPLDGYYREGRYMPVRVTADACEWLDIQGEGVLPIRVHARGAAIDAVFPLLIMSSPVSLTLRDDKGITQQFSLNLRSLGA